MQTLSLIQAEVKAPKGQFNAFGKYKYRSAEDILEAVKPVVNSRGFSITISDTIIMVGDRYYVQAVVTLTDGKETYTATACAREEESKKGQDASQTTGSSSSYARKYALSGLFGLDDTKDSDATNTHGKELSANELSWKVAIDKCATEKDLTALYETNKHLIGTNQSILNMFTSRKLAINGK
jgi:hypothetical protein